jgi:hypothetical protein
MMNESKVLEYISDKLPEIKFDLKRRHSASDIAESIQMLADFTKRRVVQKDFKMVQKCFQLAEKIFHRGDMTVKKAINDIYVFAFPAMLIACSRREQTKVRSYIPSSLYGLFLKQLKFQRANQ